MEFEYRGWVIDATPDFLLGQFFAHARLIRASPDDDADAEMHIERNLAWFENQDDAIQAAYQCAIVWIDKHNGSIASTDADPAVSHNDLPTETPAR
ncbi:hypothetical protein GNZ12_30575 [Paraburkholderia sp. 1N]|uniref:Uncharacterized protein n=1 Tax=Paraburkholderia solitsugae TaxID=2675748 RepID=A0ABX2BXV9_9BURK|nr:hypothetical protein [Paraburkholderia solitsugae]NPT45591.1 hypothetical protein [Paraburkholderia solitsugae]